MVTKMNTVMTLQEPAQEGVVKEEIKQVQLRELLSKKDVFEQLGLSEETFFQNCALLVNAQSVQSLDVYVDQTAQVVVLPRIIGG